MSELVFPVVVKPVCGTGSVDVLLCRAAAEVAAHVTKLLACKTNERGMEITPEALIEEYVHGPEYSVETFNHCVVGITGKHLSPEPHFVETGHDFPAELPPAIAQLLGSTVLTALRALGLGFGAAHTEIRYSPERGPVLIEVNPRLAGGFIPWLIKLALGVDLIHATVALVSGHEADLRPKHAGSASIRFIVSPEEGVLHAMNGLDEAKTMPGIADVRLYSHSGNYISLKHDFRDRLGHVIATGPSADAAASIASKALSQIKINFAPPLELAK